MPKKPSTANRDVVIIGGGHNGLVTAFYLAKAGFKPLVLERRAQPGGAAITEEFHPGFRCSTLAHSAGPLRPDVVRDMQLAKHGLKMITPEVELTSLTPDGRRSDFLSGMRKNPRRKSASSPRKMRQSIRSSRPRSARMGRVIGKALALAPPNIDNPSSGDLWGMLNTGRAVRKLGRRDMYRLLRWGPMAVADLVAEYFETELVAGHHRRPRHLRNISWTVVSRQQPGVADARCRRRASRRHFVVRRRRHGRRDPSHGRCRAASRSRNPKRRRSD